MRSVFRAKLWVHAFCLEVSFVWLELMIHGSCCASAARSCAAAVHRPEYHTQRLERCKAALQITTLCCLTALAHWLIQPTDGRRRHGNRVPDLTCPERHQLLLSNGSRCRRTNVTKNCPTASTLGKYTIIPRAN